MESNLNVKVLDKTSLSEQISVYQQAFQSRKSIEEIEEYWLNKHYKNPFRASYIFGVYDGTQLVSINAFMPLKYIYNGKMVYVIESCESGTVPLYRGKGIWSMVIKYAMTYFKEEGFFDFVIGFPNYHNSYNGFLKLNWIEVDRIQNNILVCNGALLFKYISGKKSNILFKLLEVQKLKVLCVRNKRYKVVETSVFSRENADGFSLVMDKEFYMWKQVYKNLFCFELINDEKKSVAVCWYAVEEHNGVNVVILYAIQFHEKKWSTEKECKGIYASCLHEIMKKNKNVAFIRTWVMPNTINAKLLKSLMFMKSKHQNPFIIYSLKEDRVLRNELTKGENWESLSFFDLD